MLSRVNQRLVVPSQATRQVEWSTQLNRLLQPMLVVANLLIAAGFIGSGLKLIPVALGGRSVLIGWLCLILALVLLSGLFIWRMHQRYGLKQLTAQLFETVKQRLPEVPSQQTLYSVVRFAGQLCVAMVAVGWGFLRVIAASGVLDGESEDRGEGWFYNSRTHKFDHGLDPGGIYSPFDD